MAKLGSSSCRLLLQGMMLLLALLLLASIQAGPVMAQEQGLVEQLGKQALDHGAEKAVDYANKEFLASGLCKQKGMERFCNGWKKGYTISKYLCKAQGWMDKLNPGGASFSPYFVIYRYGDQPSVTYLGSPCTKFAEPQVPAAGTGATTLVPSSRYYPRNDVP